MQFDDNLRAPTDVAGLSPRRNAVAARASMATVRASGGWLSRWRRAAGAA